MSTATIALAGNPNTGKSSIFNTLTGSRQHVGNWPGKTVARDEGDFTRAGDEFRVVDLPGTYSLCALSPEEVVARDYLLCGEADGVVIVVDAANLERNLYLATQILEMGAAALVALNMTDVAARRGITVDAGKLSTRLGVPVVSTIARTGRGMDDLRDAIAGLVVREGA